MFQLYRITLLALEQYEWNTIEVNFCMKIIIWRGRIKNSTGYRGYTHNKNAVSPYPFDPTLIVQRRYLDVVFVNVFNLF